MTFLVLVNMQKAVFVLFSILFFSVFINAQSNAIAVFDENTNMRSVELLNLPSNIDNCKGNRAIGRILEVKFNVDGKITGFNLKTKYKRKLVTLYFWFPEEAYTRLTRKEADKLITLVKKNNRVKISFNTCGEKAQADFVDSIYLL